MSKNDNDTVIHAGLGFEALRKREDYQHGETSKLMRSDLDSACVTLERLLLVALEKLAKM